MKKILTLSLLILMVLSAIAQKKQTYEYMVKDTHHLKMDVYAPVKQNDQHACLIYIFGGGFINGSRNDTAQVNPIKRWALEHGFVFVAIDYRLGLKGLQHYSIVSGVKKFQLAIDMAAEDLIDATSYLLKNLLKTPQYTIDPTYIVTMGNSAGAITALQADYFLGNRMHNATQLPDTFRYAGVMSFAGGIFSTNGRVKYRVQPPAPTLFCHGTADNLVNYKQTEFANIGFYGSSAIVKRFEKYDYPYYFRRYREMGHEVAIVYFIHGNLMEDFVNNYVFKKQHLRIDESYRNPALDKYRWKNYKVRDLKKS